MKVYEKLAYLLNAKEINYEKIDHIVKEYLPYGSGFDSGCKIEVEKEWKNRIIITTEFHRLNDAGYYVGWSPYRIIVFPTFHGIDLTIYGRQFDGLKDYVAETIYEHMNKTYHSVYKERV